jgi:hypothetical protein
MHPFESTGIGPCGNSLHQQFPTGLHSITAPHLLHLVSIDSIIPLERRIPIFVIRNHSVRWRGCAGPRFMAN